MKSLFVIMALALSFNAFAGAEEHDQAQACYYISLEDSSPMNDRIPQNFCLETLNVNPSAETITAFSWFNQSLYENLKIDYVARKNEDGYSFRSSSILRDSLNGLGDSERITLKIKGVVNNYGEGDIKFLEVSVEQVFRENFVETPVLKNVYNYKR